MKRAGYDTKAMYQAGLQQYSNFGGEVVGLDPQQLLAEQRQFVALAGSPASSASSTMTLAMEGSPLWRQALGPLLTWSTVCWKAAVDGGFQLFVDLPRLHQLAGRVLACLPTRWGDVRGPLGAAALSMKRIGWNFVHPFLVRTDTGVELALTAVSLALLGWHVRTAWKKYECRAAGRVLRTDCQIDPTAYQKASRSAELKAHHKALLRAFLSQAVWSNHRLSSLGYDVDQNCQKCGAESDSLYHRLWRCSCTEALRQERFSGQELEWLEHSPAAHLVALGLQALPYLPEDRPIGLRT